MTQILSTNTFCEAKWVVSALASNGTHTTIQSAINSAASGDTVFIREGTYTEDLNLKAGVLLTCYRGSGVTPEVTIIGNNTFTGTGTATIADCQLQTNANFFATVSGANASNLKLVNCAINITNNTGISYTNSNAASSLKLEICTCQITAGGNAIYSMSSVGTLELRYSNFLNSGGSITQSSNSAGIVNIYYCQMASPIATSGTGVINSNYALIDCSLLNVTAITTAGTGTSTIRYNDALAGTASAISIGAGSRINLYQGLINSSNANAITGAGTLKYGGVVFTNTSTSINVTTQIPIAQSVPQGGTADSTLTTAYGVLTAGTTATGPVQTIVPGTAGTVLTSGGAAAIPTWTAVASSVGRLVAVTAYQAAGSFTWTANVATTSVIVKVVGGGGGGAGTSATTVAGAGGGGGGYAETYTSSQGASQTVTVGAGGIAGTTGPSSGGNGGISSFGALAVATGGLGGGIGSATTLGQAGSGGGGTTGTIMCSGGAGGASSLISTTNGAPGGAGGNSVLGGGGLPVTGSTGGAGGPSGGGGAGSGQTSNTIGGAGGNGCVIVYEYS